MLVPISEKYKSASSFLTDILLDSPAVDGEDSEHIVISTIHSAKGLEFKKVFILSCVEGIIPSAMSAQDEDGLEEERRIFYVAVTRAKEDLFIMAPETIIKFGQFEVPSISRFVSENDIIEKYLQILEVS